MSRRTAAWTTLVWFAVGPGSLDAGEAQPPNKLPNIVWITSEDHGPHLGCYGDKVARTPNLDRLAAKGMRFRFCWSNAPVCAPARTAIISGMYPTATGAEHMRSLVVLPTNIAMFPALLRALGYYCTNRVKEDYNLVKKGKVWDDSSKQAHWRNRPAGAPFFAVFNSTKSHESQLHKYPLPTSTDPAQVRVPACHPDTPEVRQDWARYYDTVALVDADAGVVLRELEEAGLLEDTIVFYFADHGPGLPRFKRTPLHSGLHVPMIVYFPERWKHLAPPDYRPGGESDRLISFVDLAPTMLSLAGQPPPPWMQGSAFAGKFLGPAPKYLHGFRGRMDERYDLQRSVTDGRYVYLRNFLPHMPAGQHVEYMFKTKTTRIWKDLFDLGKLNAPQARFWTAPRDTEELYDLQNDPDEVHNLAHSKRHGRVLDELRQALRAHALAVRDLGFLPEGEIHTRAADRSPYELGRDRRRYPLEHILEVAERATNHLAPYHEFPRDLQADDDAVRYWAYLGALIHAPKEARRQLQTALKTDRSPYVRIVAAEAIAAQSNPDDATDALGTLLELSGPKAKSIYVRLAALNALDRVGVKARGHLATIKSWPTAEDTNDRAASGIPRLINKIVQQLDR
ncbi:MAG: sulfatase-like hydrolase/transferase [Gemmataceae bacterium]|nr:sulfatase-like hydrolase/transferase [Gemmataceae bacterium]